MSRHPLTKWAQRSDKVFITIELPDAKDVKLNLQPDGHFHFSAVTGPDNVPYKIDFDLYDKVNVNESRAAVGSRIICYIVKKAEEKWWSRLLRQEGKPPVFLKADWEKWIDEDIEPEMDEDFDFGALDFSKFNLTNADEDLEEDSTDEDEVVPADDEPGDVKEAPSAVDESGALTDAEKSGTPVDRKESEVK